MGDGACRSRDSRPRRKKQSTHCPFPRQPGSGPAHLASSPDVEGETGGYYQRNRVREPSDLARDDVLAEALYAESARLVGLGESPA